MHTEKIDILLIIENKIQGEFIEMFFEDESQYSFNKLFNGREAFEYLLDNYDSLSSSVIIISYQLPEMDGLKIMAKLKEHELNYAIIFLTADKTVERALEAMKAGATDFIPKAENLQTHLPEMVNKVYLIQQEKLEQARIKQELEENRRELEKLSIVARETDNGVIIFDKFGKLEWMNEGFTKFVGYAKDEFISIYGDSLIATSSDEKIRERVDRCMNLKQTQSYTSKMQRKDGGEIWLQTNLTPVIDDEGELSKLVVVESDISEIKKAEAIILKHSENIENSIKYAKRIQDALLSSADILTCESIISDALVFLKPHSIVSGDFYWFNKIGNKLIIAAADCTGHGVPGAFMSMLGISSLNTISRQLYMKGQEFLTSDEVLNRLKKAVIKSLSQTGESGEAQDGMDIALCIIDTVEKNLQFSGAYNPLYLVRNGDIQVLKADRMPIGIHRKKTKDFTKSEIQLQPEDMIYLFSDGFPDQFGGADSCKYMQKNFRQLLLDIHQNPMQEQYKSLDNELVSWRGDTPQTDDVLIIGIKFNI